MVVLAKFCVSKTRTARETYGGCSFHLLRKVKLVNAIQNLECTKREISSSCKRYILLFYWNIFFDLAEDGPLDGAPSTGRLE